MGNRFYNSSNYANYNAPMTAFGRYMRTSDNLFEEGFAGYMKKIRIWKSAKDNEYVQNSYNGTAEVTVKKQTWRRMGFHGPNLPVRVMK